MADSPSVILSGIAYSKTTGTFRSWYQHGRTENGKFIPDGPEIDDTHKSSQVELWEMAQALGIFAPYPK
jgi:hypothetical protein